MSRFTLTTADLNLTIQRRLGQFEGVAPPIKQASRYFWPPHLNVDQSASTVATVGARYYVVPFYIERPKAFAGAWTFNGGTGDNGDKVKIAAYNEAAGGGPGTLAKSFGEVTLTGASAVRTFASAWTASAGMYYLELVTDNAVTMFAMNAAVFSSAAGYVQANVANNLMGVTTPTVGAAVSNNMPCGEYVGGTYANFPEATSLTPNTTAFSNVGIPLFGLYT